MASEHFSVTFPDGHTQEFDGPTGMSDSDVFARAIQERSFDSGKIQTSWLGGAAKQMGQEKAANAALMTGAALATRQPAAATAAVTAIAPLAATWIDYATKHLTGENPDTPTVTNQAVDLAKGAAEAYGPGVISKTGGAMAGELMRMGGSRPTLPQASARAVTRVIAPILEKLDAITPEKLTATVREGVQLIKNSGQRIANGISADDADLMKASVAKGMKPTTAARIISGGNTQQMQALMKIIRQPPAEFRVN